MQTTAAEISAGSPPLVRGKARLRTIESLDGRTVAARRAKELAAGFEAELGGTITATQRFAIERAAALVALSEDAKARRLAGDPTISLDAVVRIDGAAARSVRALGIKVGPAKAPSIHEYIASLAPAPVATPSAAMPSTPPVATETHYAPPHDDGEPSGEPPG
jgi:hypothetical protein